MQSSGRKDVAQMAAVALLAARARDAAVAHAAAVVRNGIGADKALTVAMARDAAVFQQS